jgi:tetratricopeptide (TPR) repeat protein
MDDLREQGFSAHERGDLDGARRLYRDALRRSPDDVEVMHALGIVEVQSGDYGAAVELLVPVARRVGSAAAHSDLANALLGSGRVADALDCYDRAIALRPDLAAAHLNRGHALRSLARRAEAVSSYERAIAVNPQIIDAHTSRATALLELGRWMEALESAQSAVALGRDSAGVHTLCALALAGLRRFEESLASFDRAIALDPACRDAFLGRMALRRRLNRRHEALVDCEQAIALQSDASAHCDRGTLLTEMKQCEAGLASFDQAIALDPEHAAAHFNRSICLLLAGRYEGAWAGYERRRQILKEDAAEGWREAHAPRWSGDEPIAGKRLLLRAEQGFGDTLQFCRYAKPLAAAGAHVILEVQRPLASLLASLGGEIQVISQGDPLPAHDYWCPLMSLPLASRTSLSTIPTARRYVHSSPSKIERWNLALGIRSRPRIGLVWSGSYRHQHDHNRNVAFQDLVARLPDGFMYVSLQKEQREADRRALKRHPEIYDASGGLQDFGDTAALCDCLDFIISVDTAVAHLCGALGRPAWILLPWYPDWRWMLDRADSPWYPTLTLYRQMAPGDWRGVIDRLAGDLERQFGALPS